MSPSIVNSKRARELEPAEGEGKSKKKERQYRSGYNHF